METQAIAEALGGRRVLGKTVKKPDDLLSLFVRTAGHFCDSAGRETRLGNMALIPDAILTYMPRRYAAEVAN